MLLVGWDAADWQMIHPLIEQGLMPTMARLLDSGAWGNLATTRPILSPILWNTIATGKRADQHGVCGFTEPVPDGPGVRPVASTSRRCKALWNILTQCGLRSNVIGWYASHPAEPIAGVMVSNQFEQFAKSDGGVGAVSPESVSPRSRIDELAACRVHPDEIEADAILPFVPDAAAVAAIDPKRLGKLQHMLAQTATIHAVATQLIARDDWDLTAVYYEGIDRFGHEFMHFHPPKMDQVSQEEFDAYRHCMVGIYRFHDMLLETLLKLAGDDTAVIVISDHGYYNDHNRPDPREGKSGPVDWHRPYGIFAAAGKGVRSGARLYGASILDVTPTVLNLLGFPAGRDMAGRVLAEAFEVAEVPRVDSWESIAGDAGQHPAEFRVDPAEAQAAMEQLIALGYISPPGPDDEKTRRETVACNQFHLAHSHTDANQYAAAISILDRLDPCMRDTAPAQVLLATCLMGARELPRARAVITALPPEDQASAQVGMLWAALEYSEGSVESALGRLRALRDQDARLPGIHSRLGEMLVATGRHREAVEAFTAALESDPESAEAFAGLAACHLELGDPQAALDHGLVAAALVHQSPKVHLTIGKALGRLGDHAAAVQALELCVVQAPTWGAGYEALSAAYRAVGRTKDADAIDAGLTSARAART